MGVGLMPIGCARSASTGECVLQKQEPLGGLDGVEEWEALRMLKCVCMCASPMGRTRGRCSLVMLNACCMLLEGV